MGNNQGKNFLLVLHIIFVLVLSFAFWLEILLGLLLLLVYFGNLTIYLVIRYFKKKIPTGDEFLEDFSSCIKPLYGFLEIFFFSVLFLLNQTTFVIGWLVIKAVGSFNQEEKSGTVSPSVSIFRIGSLLSIFVSFSIAFCMYQVGFKEGFVYKSIFNFFLK